MMATEEEKNEEIEAPLGEKAGDGSDDLFKSDAAATVAAATETSVEVKNGDEGAGDKQIKMKVAADAPWRERMWEVFTTFWPLGLVAFGGPTVRSSAACP